MDNKTAKIMIVSDLHYISPDLKKNRELFQSVMDEGDGKAAMYAEEILPKVLEKIEEEKPDVLLLTGDMTFNGEYRSHQEVTEALMPFKAQGIEILAVAGNHDVNIRNCWNFSGEEKTPERNINAEEFRDMYENLYSDKERIIYRDETSLSHIYESKTGLWFLALDVNCNEQERYVSEATLAWIDRCLDEADKLGRTVIPLCHQNALMQTGVFLKGFTIDNYEALTDVYIRHGLRCNISGHLHIQSIRERQGLYDIAVASAGVDPGQYGILYFNEEEGFEYDTKEFDMGQNAYDAFFRTFRNHALKGIPKGTLSEEEESELCRRFAEVHYIFFSGKHSQMLPYEEYEDMLKIYGEGSKMEAYLKPVFMSERKDGLSVKVEF